MKLRSLMSVIMFNAALLISSNAWAADEGRTLEATQCKAAWTAISPDDESLSEEGAAKFVLNVTDIDSNSDGSISAVEFKEGCTAGQLRVAMDFPCCP
jgi:hypothetical protein